MKRQTEATDEDPNAFTGKRRHRKSRNRQKNLKA